MFKQLILITLSSISKQVHDKQRLPLSPTIEKQTLIENRGSKGRMSAKKSPPYSTELARLADTAFVPAKGALLTNARMGSKYHQYE